MEFKPKSKAVVAESCGACGKKRLPPGLSTIFEGVCTCESQAGDQADLERVHLDHYQLVEKIGTGSITTAYKAKRQDVDGFFVVKILREQYAENPRTAKRFKIESERACNLSHANLAAIYEVGSTREGLPYLVTDYLEGQSVEEYLKKEGFFEEKEAMAIFLQICDGLAEAHKRDLIHRDLKPNNIILKRTESGDIAKIADFGIAKVLPNPGRETKYFTPEGEAFGDPRYMSPEQCLGQRLDARSDVFSLGCIMYKCLTGKAPLSGSNQMSIAVKQLNEQPKSIRERFVDIDISAGLERVIMRALEKDADDRYQSVDDLQRDLLLVKAGKTPPAVARKIKAPPVSPVPPPPRQASAEPVKADKVRSQEKTDAPKAHHSAVPQELADKVVAFSINAALQEKEKRRRKSLLTGAIVMVVSAVVLLLIIVARMLGPDAMGPDPLGLSLLTPHQFHSDYVYRPVHEPAPVVPERKSVVIRNTDGQPIFTIRSSELNQRQALEEAIKASASLTSVALSKADLSDADLHDAKLPRAELWGADLSGADLRNANLSYANLSGANMKNANLTGADLSHASLQDADLTGADLTKAKLSWTDFRNATLVRAKVHFRKADHAKLEYSNGLPASQQKMGI